MVDMPSTTTTTTTTTATTTPPPSSSSSSSVWSYSLGHVSHSPTSINEELALNQHNILQDHYLQQQQQQQRRFSIDQSNMDELQHPLRTIWSNNIMDHQYNSHQRRSSLSDYSNADDWSPTLMNGGLQFNSDNAYNFGRRHSVAGPVLNHHLKVINEVDNISLNSKISQQQQRLYLNKGILDHIDEYFGNGNRQPSIKSPIPYPNNNNNNSINHINNISNNNNNNNNEYSYTKTSFMETNGYSKTMTAGGEAAAFGGSTILMGKGIPLHHFLDSNTKLYIIEFKACRTDICYIMQGDQINPVLGDLVIVEADRGRDLGKVANVLTANEIMTKQQQRQQQQQQQNDLNHEDNYDQDNNNNNNSNDSTTPSSSSSSSTSLLNDDNNSFTSSSSTLNDNNNNNNSNNNNNNNNISKCQVKRLFRLADALEITTLYTKKSDEEKALLVCQTKVQQRELPMQVVNAEYQWDRRKLTFYFLADQRIDFRELVRELFKIYKTRIWMCALKSNTNELLPE
ncbi:unnamed protein product [Cunninghamella echinulata]